MNLPAGLPALPLRSSTPASQVPVRRFLISQDPASLAALPLHFCCTSPSLSVSLFGTLEVNVTLEASKIAHSQLNRNVTDAVAGEAAQPQEPSGGSVGVISWNEHKRVLNAWGRRSG